MSHIKVAIHWSYKEIEGFTYDDYGYPEFDPQNKQCLDGLYFWYFEGNGSCDCNRSQIIGLKNRLPCGEEIDFLMVSPCLLKKSDLPGWRTTGRPIIEQKY